MIIFLITLGYLSIIAIGILLTIKLYELSLKIKTKKESIDKLDKELYAKLRDIQFKAKYISNTSFKLLKQKNSLLGEFVSNILIYLLPFKKIKNLVLLIKLGKKVF